MHPGKDTKVYCYFVNRKKNKNVNLIKRLYKKLAPLDRFERSFCGLTVRCLTNRLQRNNKILFKSLGHPMQPRLLNPREYQRPLVFLKFIYLYEKRENKIQNSIFNISI